MNALTYFAILYTLVVATTLVGWPTYLLLRDPVRRWTLRRRAERAQDARRLEGWAVTLRNLNLADKVGVLYTGRHCQGIPVSHFVVLTYSAGPKHRRLVSA